MTWPVVTNWHRVAGTIGRAALLVLMVIWLSSSTMLAAERRGFAPDSPVIELLPETIVRGSVIRIIDVADVTGGTDAIRRKIEQLDLDDAPAKGTSVTIGAEQIDFRLRLAGVDPNRVLIRGNESVVLAGRMPIEQTGAGSVRNASFSKPAGDRHAQSPRGPAKLNAVATNRPAGSAVKNETPIEGQPAGTMTVSVKTPAAHPGAIKRGDQVRLVVRTADLEVTTMGEALQPGRVGEVIQVKNLSTGVTRFGKVLSASMIEVQP